MKYTIYYKILSKKMKSVIEADSELQAQIKLKESFQILKVIETHEDEIKQDETVEHLKNILGMK